MYSKDRELIFCEVYIMAVLGNPLNFSYDKFIFLVFSNCDEKPIHSLNSEFGGLDPL